MDRRQQIVLVATTVARIVLVGAMVLTAYAISPGYMAASGRVVVRIVIAVIVLAAATAVAIRSVWNADHPVFRAFETISTIVLLLIVTFASIYVTTSSSDPNAFSEVLDHTGALYFALTTATTVGFGDIAPQSNPARIIVMAQMVANVVVIGVATRLLIGAARRRSTVVD